MSDLSFSPTRATVVMGIGGALAVLGGLLPWISVLGFGVSGAQLGGPAFVVMALGLGCLVGAGVFALDRRRFAVAWIVVSILGVVGLGTMLVNLYDIYRVSQLGLDLMSILGVGFWVALAGPAVALVGALLARNEVASGTQASAGAPRTPSGSSLGESVRRILALRGNVRQFGMLIALVVIVAFFQFTTAGVMLKPQNVTNVFLQNGYIIAMALGMLLIIVAGHIDLSVGSVAAFTGAIAAVLMVNSKIDPVLASAVALIIGGMIGAWHGFWVAYMGIPSFIVTLSGMLLFRGLTLFMLEGQPVGPFPESFRSIASGFLPEPIGSIQDPFGPDMMRLTTLILAGVLCAGLILLDVAGRREKLRYGFHVTPFRQFVARNAGLTVAIMFLAYRLAAFNGLPVVLLLVGLLIAVYMFLTGRTVIGRRIYAVGGNAKAATLSGVKTKRMVFLTFVNMGVLSAVGGLIATARFNSATPKAGDGFELDVIAATFVGGASAYGGVGTVAGAVIGALVLGVLNIGMGLMGIGIDYQFAIKALVLLFAVFIDVRGKSKDG